MNGFNRALVALSVCAGFAVAGLAYAQQANAPQKEPLKPILSGKFVPPIRGTAEIWYTKPKVTRKGTEVITVMQVKNVSAAPIAALKCTEIWYDKQRALVPGTGDIYTHKKLLAAGEVITITLTDPIDPRMDTNLYQFSHMNGQVKAKAVPKF